MGKKMIRYLLVVALVLVLVAGEDRTCPDEEKDAITPCHCTDLELPCRTCICKALLPLSRTCYHAQILVKHLKRQIQRKGGNPASCSSSSSYSSPSYSSSSYSSYSRSQPKRRPWYKL